MSTGNKPIGIILGVVLGLGAVGAGAWFWQQSADDSQEDSEEGQQAEGQQDATSAELAIANKLPKDTLALTSTQGLASLFLEFEEEFEDLVDSDEVVAGLEEIEEQLGFNPMDPMELNKTGFSFTDPWTAAAFGDLSKEEVSVAIFLPVDDEERVEELFEELSDKLDADIDSKDIADADGWIFEDELAAVLDDGHLVLCIPIEPEDDFLDTSIDCLEDLMELEEEDSLVQNEHFQAALDLVKNDWNWLAYANVEAFGEIGAEAFEDEWDDMPRDVRKFIEDLLERAPANVMTAQLTREAVTIQFIQLLNTELAHQFALNGNDQLAKRIPGDPLLVTRWSVKLHSVWNVLKDWKLIEDQLEEVIDDVEDELDIDITDDVIGNLAGHFSLIALESKRGSLPLPVDLIFYAPVRDQDAAIETFETLLDVAKDMNPTAEIDEDQRDDGMLYMVDASGISVCFGLVLDHMLVIGSANQDCEDIVEDIEDGDESFLDELPKSVSEKLTTGPSTYMYMDSQNVMKQAMELERPGPDEEKGIEILNQLMEGIEISSWSGPEHTTMKIVIRADDEDFGPGIESFVELVMDEMR